MRYKIYQIRTDEAFVYGEGGSVYVGTNISHVVEFTKTGGCPYIIRELFVPKDVPEQNIWLDVYIIREDSIFFNASFICSNNMIATKFTKHMVTQLRIVEGQISQSFLKLKIPANPNA